MKAKPHKNATAERIATLERELPMWERKLQEALRYYHEADAGGAQQMADVYYRHAKNIVERIEKYKSELHALKTS